MIEYYNKDDLLATEYLNMIREPRSMGRKISGMNKYISDASSQIRDFIISQLEARADYIAKNMSEEIHGTDMDACYIYDVMKEYGYIEAIEACKPAIIDIMRDSFTQFLIDAHNAEVKVNKSLYCIDTDILYIQEAHLTAEAQRLHDVVIGLRDIQVGDKSINIRQMEGSCVDLLKILDDATRTHLTALRALISKLEENLPRKDNGLK